MGNFLDRMLVVIGMSLDIPLSLWPVSIILVAASIWSIRSLVKANQLASRNVVLTSALSATVFIGLPVYAAAFWAEHPYSAVATQEPPFQGLPVTILKLLWWGYMACMLLMPVFAKEYRLPLAALSALMVWVNFGLAFICLLAVAGVGP